MSGTPATGLVSLVGGSGFVGRHVAQYLTGKGWRVRIVSRHISPEQIAKWGDPVSRLETRQAGLDSPELADTLQGSDAIVNLVGILSEKPGQNFDQVHRAGAERLAAIARSMGIKKFVQISSIGADEHSSSAYARSKRAGERAVLAQLPEAVILRPSIIFGPGDGFFCRFNTMAKLSPALPLIGGGHSLFQPVYVGDVAAAINAALAGQARPGMIYELGGPEKRSFADLLASLGEITGRKRLLLPLPFAAARPLAGLLEAVDKMLAGHLPALLLITRDQVAALQQDNVVSMQAEQEKRTLQGLGLTPQSIAAIVPAYLTGA